MKILLAIAVLTCLFTVGLTQSQDCQNRVTQLATCISRAGSSSNDNFCRDCGDALLGYFTDCGTTAQVNALKQSKLYMRSRNI